MIVTTFDTETTGLLRSQWTRVIEVGLVKHDLETGEILNTDSFFVKPFNFEVVSFDIPEKISGISKEEVSKNGISFLDCIPRIANFAMDTKIFAWNLAFDQRMIQRFAFDSLEKEGTRRSLNLLEKLQWGGCWQHLYTWMNQEKYLEMISERSGFIPMRNAFKIEGWDNVQSHRALDDALHTAKLGNKIFQHQLKHN